MKLSLYPVIKVDLWMWRMKKLECATGCSEITSKNKHLYENMCYLLHLYPYQEFSEDFTYKSSRFSSSFKTFSEKFQIWIFPISLGVVPIIVSGSRVCGIIIICVSASSNPVRIFMVITSYISCVHLSSWIHEIYEYTITVMLNLFDIV